MKYPWCQPDFPRGRAECAADRGIPSCAAEHLNDAQLPHLLPVSVGFRFCAGWQRQSGLADQQPSHAAGENTCTRYRSQPSASGGLIPFGRPAAERWYRTGLLEIRVLPRSLRHYRQCISGVPVTSPLMFFRPKDNFCPIRITPTDPSGPPMQGSVQAGEVAIGTTTWVVLR